MNIFINEILENEQIKSILLEDTSQNAEAQKIAQRIMAGEELRAIEPGILPLRVLGYLTPYAIQKNEARGIDRAITIATLKDVNLWLENYQSLHGKIGLGEFHWLYFHYIGDLFRLGRLQFRIAKSLAGTPSGKKAIEVHIPQGEPLRREACIASFDAARTFFKKHFPEEAPEYFTCDSWLLNPNLAELLGESANIVQFMRLWTQMPFPKDNSRQAIERTFGFGFQRQDLPVAPENTSLQKKMKAYLLAGGSLDQCAGYIKI